MLNGIVFPSVMRNFTANRKINAKIKDRNSFRPLSKVWTSWHKKSIHKRMVRFQWWIKGNRTILLCIPCIITKLAIIELQFVDIHCTEFSSNPTKIVENRAKFLLRPLVKCSFHCTYFRKARNWVTTSCWDLLYWMSHRSVKKCESYKYLK